MQLYNPKLYELWVNITKGRVENPSLTIVETFGANYVLSDLKHKDFLRQARTDAQLEEVYQDEDAIIFRVRAEPQKGGLSQINPLN